MTSTYQDSRIVELAGKILIISIVVLSVVLIFVFFLHLYAKWFWYRRGEHLVGPNTHRRRHQEQQSGVTVLRRGLNPSFLKTIPVIPFDPKDFKQELECAVCLSEVRRGEKARILPKCNHGFHLECIDMWFHSHSTCPICRNSVSDQTEVSVENLLEIRQSQQEYSTEQDFPTNILFWGDESEVSTLTSQLEEANNAHNQEPPRTDLAIDIPRQIEIEIDDDQDQKSPVSSRMRSLRRIFSNPFGSATANNEQGTRSLH